MDISPVQILVKYLTDSSNCAFLCVDSSKKIFGTIHGTVFFPQGLKVSAIVCVENGLNLVGLLLDGFQFANKAQILTQNANLPLRTC